jgi:hypothetical protein
MAINGRKIHSARLDKLFDLDIEKEEKAEGRLRDELEDAAILQTKSEKEIINSENGDYILDEIERLSQFVEESLLKFQQEMNARQKE